MKIQKLVCVWLWNIINGGEKKGKTKIEDNNNHLHSSLSSSGSFRSLRFSQSKRWTVQSMVARRELVQQTSGIDTNVTCNLHPSADCHMMGYCVSGHNPHPTTSFVVGLWTEKKKELRSCLYLSNSCQVVGEDTVRLSLLFHYLSREFAG